MLLSAAPLFFPQIALSLRSFKAITALAPAPVGENRGGGGREPDGKKRTGRGKIPRRPLQRQA